MSQQPPPQQPQPPQTQPGYLRLHLQGNALINMITPTVRIDGQHVPVRNGENVLPVHPGQHVVSANAQWMWTYGHAEQPFSVAPGQTADVWYAPPALTFMKGAIGTQKQKTPGLAGAIAIIGGVIGLVLLLVLLFVLLTALLGS